MGDNEGDWEEYVDFMNADPNTLMESDRHYQLETFAEHAVELIDQIRTVRVSLFDPSSIDNCFIGELSSVVGDRYYALHFDRIFPWSFEELYIFVDSRSTKLRELESALARINTQSHVQGACSFSLGEDYGSSTASLSEFVGQAADWRWDRLIKVDDFVEEEREEFEDHRDYIARELSHYGVYHDFGHLSYGEQHHRQGVSDDRIETTPHPPNLLCGFQS